MKNMIDISSANLKDIMKHAYELSQPQGLGFLHYTEGPLDDETIDNYLEHYSDNPRIALYLDYVHGRACKLTVFRGEDGEGFFINNEWIDHSDTDLEELINRLKETK
jgi:hypothetical protein